jgi:hypothetical protein
MSPLSRGLFSSDILGTEDDNVNFGATNPDGMLRSYSEYLQKIHPENAKRFDQLRISDREAAIAEAVVFGILRGFNVDPQIHDQLNSGGPDFICCAYPGPLAPRRPDDRFVVEATSLDPDAVTDRSHIANEVPEDLSGGAFGLVTRNICNKAKAKATQLANYTLPRVLAIVSSHAGVAALFNNATAKWALVSEPHWRHEIGSDTVDTAEYTDLESSLFIRPGPDGTIVPCRQTISAILLVAVYGGQSESWGILHPEAARPFNYAFLPNLPFVRIAEWPVRNGKILTEWVIADPHGYTAYQFPIQLPKPPRKSAAAPSTT